MVIDRTSNGDVTVNQSGYLSTLLQKYGCHNLKKTPSTPAVVETFIAVEEDVEACDQKHVFDVFSLIFQTGCTFPCIFLGYQVQESMYE